MDLDGLVKVLDIDDLKILRKEFTENWSLLNQKSAYPYNLQKMKIMT